MSFLSLQPIDTARLAGSVVDPGHGAVVSFAGLVRNHHRGRRVERLSYSAYAGMAESIAAELVQQAERRWNARVAAQHRVGTLEIGEIAVFVAVAAAHRDAAFAACRWLIDDIKARVPIWKREVYADGSEAWVDPTMSADPAGPP